MLPSKLLRLWFVLLVTVLLLLVISMKHKEATTTATRNFSIVEEEQNAFIPKDASKKKVLLYTYMRGGSSYFGEIFNRNPDAVYWFEPLDAFYQAMFGMRRFQKPLNILYYSNQTERYISDLEVQEIVKFHQDILSCEFSKVPVMTFANYHNVRGTIKLTECELKPAMVDKCLELLNGVCTANPVVNDDQKTTNVLHSVENRCLNAIKAGLDGESLMVNSTVQKEAFDSYLTCYRESKQLFMDYCYTGAHDQCQRERIHAIKSIRLNMPTTQHIMEETPDLFLVYYVRDPRGIISSRRDIFSLLIFDLLVEARVLCSRMSRDLQVFRELERKFPGRVILQKYEEFARDPILEIQKTYRLINEFVPQEVIEWIQKASLNSQNVQKENVKFGTERTNSTDVSLSWRKKLSPLLITELTRICYDTLTGFHFTL